MLCLLLVLPCLVCTQPPLVVVGGHCSVQGFDAEGNELYWTVTGDNVSAMAFVDTNGDGVPELVVGSDDFEIRVFKNDDVLEVCARAVVVVFRLHRSVCSVCL